MKKVWMILAVALIGLVLMGCTGDQLAPGGHVSFAFSTDPNHPGVSWQSNKDIRCSSLTVDMQKGTIDVKDLNSDASTLGGLQGQASAQQLYYWNQGWQQGMAAAVAFMGKQPPQFNTAPPQPATQPK